MNAAQMAAQRTGQIQRSLQPGFLTFIIVQQKNNILHHDLLWKACNLRPVRLKQL
jgi:hypothetical protein